MKMLKTEKLKEKIKKYLQSDCNDLWNVSLKNGEIVCSFSGKKRFSIWYDEDTEEWYISGKEMNVQIIRDITEIIMLQSERGL